MMKVVDVSGLNSAINETQVILKKQNDQMKQIEQALTSFTSLNDSFKGKGAEAIRSFFEECHKPFLQLFQEMSAEYDRILEQIKNALHVFEPASNGTVHQQFLDDELSPGLEQARNTIMYMTDQANSIMQRVTDIVQLPKIQDDDFLMHINQAKKHVIDTSEAIMHFDYEQSSALSVVLESLRVMTQHIQTTSTMFMQQGFTVLEYTSGKLKIEDKV